MKFCLFCLLFAGGLFSTGAWSQEQVCVGEPVDKTYGERVRWYITDGGNKADACKEARPIYKELLARLEDSLKLDGNQFDLSQVVLRVSNVIRGVEIDMSSLTVGDLAKNDTWLQGKVIDQMVNAFPQQCLPKKPVGSASCDTEFQRLLDGLAAARFMSKVTDKANKDELEADLLRSAHRVAKWDKYLEAQQFQYPWELTLNYCWQQPGWSEKDSRLGRAGCFVPLMGAGIGRRIQDEYPQLGWEEVPEWRFIFLHPEVALSYSSEPSNGDKVNAALIFEWVGIYKWNWNDKWAKEGDALYDCFLDLCPLGLSFTTALIDLPDNDKVGWGPALHVRNYTLAATWHDGKNGEDDAWVYSISLNLSKLFAESDGGSGKALRTLFLE